VIFIHFDNLSRIQQRKDQDSLEPVCFELDGGLGAALLLPQSGTIHIFDSLTAEFLIGYGEGLDMARVTVEDCVLRVPNRFELVLLAGQRAREISAGAPLSLDRDDDKNPVVALREIAEDRVELAHLQDSLIRGMQKHVEMDEPEETPELEQTLFGLADPTGAVIEENATDEQAIDEELEEDMLSIEEDIDEAELPSGDEVENFEEEP